MAGTCFCGQMYSEGSTAVKQDNKTAFNWFKKAADNVRITQLILLVSMIGAVL